MIPRTLYGSIGEESVALTSDSYDVRRTRDFYRPYYDLVEVQPAGEPLATVQVRCSGRATESTTTDMRSYLQAPREPDVTMTGRSGLIFRRPVPDLTVSVSRARRLIEITGDNPTHVELQVRTLLRDQLLGQLEKLQGWTVFHAAAVQRDGTGIVFAGDRNAGKTTSMIALMSTGKFDFLSADRVKLRAGDERPQLRGMPGRCNLHRVALTTDPVLKPLAAGRHYDREGKCLVDVGDLTRLTGVEQVAAADLGLIVFPDLWPGQKGIDVELLTDRTELRRSLTAQLMEGTPADKHVHWLHYLPDTKVSLAARLAAVAGQVGETVAAVRVRSNYHEYVSALRSGSLDFLEFVT